MPAETMGELPDWLTKKFLESALRSGECDRRIAVKSMDVTRATATGDNYLSVMYRTNLKTIREKDEESVEEDVSLVVKCAPTEENVKRIASEFEIFERETHVFTVVMPEMYRLLEEASPGSFQPFAARCVYHEAMPHTSIIVLEDLKRQGFEMAERHSGLDLEHCLLVLRTLARFHAASVALHDKDPGYVKYFDERPGTQNAKLVNDFDDFFGSVLRNLANEVERWPDFSELYAQKLRNLANNIKGRLLATTKRKEDEFNVLTHGDMWVNNVMFRYDVSTKKLQDLRFVDYQLSHWTSPALDLYYFLFTSPNLDLWDKHEFLIQEYHKTLGEILAVFDLQHKHPTLEELHRHLDERAFYMIFAASIILPIVLTDPDKPMKLNDILDENKEDREVSKEDLHYSDAYRRAIRKFLPMMDSKGLL